MFILNSLLPKVYRTNICKGLIHNKFGSQKLVKSIGIKNLLRILL